MRVTSRLALVVTLSCLVATTAAMAPPALASPVGGITLSPATASLSLAKGQTEQTANFAATNHYQVAITLLFRFEQPIDATTEDLTSFLTISQPSVTLQPNQTLQQTVHLTDTKQLPPGGHRIDLVVSVANPEGPAVSVSQNIRMPLIIVKQDGAIAAIGLAGIQVSRFRPTTPQSVQITVRNEGNTIAIPRGTITITDPSGRVVRQGALNIASQAVSPRATLALTTALHKTHSALLPGLYYVNLDYGLGGGQATKHASKSYFYVSWWHLLVLVAALYGLKRYGAFIVKKRVRPPPRKLLVVRRAAS